MKNQSAILIVGFFIVALLFGCKNQNESGACKYKDGVHSAKVSMDMPGSSAKVIYPQTVDVLNCNVVKINFPSFGWLGDTKIKPAGLNSQGKTTATDNHGRVWTIVLTN